MITLWTRLMAWWRTRHARHAAHLAAALRQQGQPDIEAMVRAWRHLAGQVDGRLQALDTLEQAVCAAHATTDQLLTRLFPLLDALEAKLQPADAYLARAITLTNDLDRTTVVGTSGEFKRHAVYAALIKEFPAVPKRHLALAIEHAIQLTRSA